MAELIAPSHIVIITGLSGAGRSQAANVLEDIGYFVVDNLPIELMPNLVATVGVVDGSRSRVAVVADTRGNMDAVALDMALIDLHRDGLPTTVLFLDADDRVLARRFEETRRPHPLPGTRRRPGANRPVPLEAGRNCPPQTPTGGARLERETALPARRRVAMNRTRSAAGRRASRRAWPGRPRPVR